jgi:hypothetical protein
MKLKQLFESQGSPMHEMIMESLDIIGGDIEDYNSAYFVTLSQKADEYQYMCPRCGEDYSENSPHIYRRDVRMHSDEWYDVLLGSIETCNNTWPRIEFFARRPSKMDDNRNNWSLEHTYDLQGDMSGLMLAIDEAAEMWAPLPGYKGKDKDKS